MFISVAKLANDLPKDKPDNLAAMPYKKVSEDNSEKCVP